MENSYGKQLQLCTKFTNNPPYATQKHSWLIQGLYRSRSIWCATDNGSLRSASICLLGEFHMFLHCVCVAVCVCPRACACACTHTQVCVYCVCVYVCDTESETEREERKRERERDRDKHTFKKCTSCTLPCQEESDPCL